MNMFTVICINHLVLMYILCFTDIAVSSNSSDTNYVPLYLNESFNMFINNNITKSTHMNNNQNIKSLLPPIIQSTSSTSKSSINLISQSPVLLNQVPLSSTSLNGYDEHIIELSNALETQFKDIRNNELGVTDIQEIFDAMEFVPVHRNDLEIAINMSNKLNAKLNQSKKIINEMCKILLSNKEQNYGSLIYPCPNSNEQILKQKKYQNENFNIIQYLSIKNINDNYNNNNNLTKIFNNSEKNNIFIENFLKDIFKKKKIFFNFKQQYFLSRKNHLNFDCNDKFDDIDLQRNYINAINNKHIVLLIDNGVSLNREQFEISKSIAKKFVNLLENENDFIEIITVSDKILNQTNENCFKSKEFRNKENLLKFIDDIQKSNGITNHTLGFEKAFEIAKYKLTNSRSKVEVPFMILYISRGFLSTFNDTKKVLEVIAKWQNKLPYPILINTFEIVIDDKFILYEKQFLTDIAKQNFLKYNIRTNFEDKKLFNTSGHMIQIFNNNYDNYRISKIFINFYIDKFLNKKINLHFPRLDINSKTLIVSMTRTCENHGLFGIDLYLSDLAEDVTYYNRYQNSYAFMIDIYGRTIMHPSFPRPIKTKENYIGIDISNFEIDYDFLQIKKEILLKSYGNLTINTSRNDSNLVTYSWSRAFDFYVIVIVSKLNDDNRTTINLRNLSPRAHYTHQTENVNVLYHLEISPTDMNADHFCNHFKQIATLESGAVYLSATSFLSPFYHLKNNDKLNRNISLQNIQPFLAYIKDTETLLFNPGLLPEVRNDVAVLQKIMYYFKHKFNEDGGFKNYVVRRYITTINGVMQIYPGTRLDIDFEPTRKNWFRKAMEHPGKIVITEPYLDNGGAGKIVTVSHTIFEGKSNALHNENDLPVAVVSIDFTHGWFYKILLKSSNFCSEINVKCFLMEDKGYLISHPKILEPGSNFYLNKRSNDHITYKESYVANDILNHDNFIKKKICINFLNRTIQRYYQLNTTLDGLVTNFVNGEKTKYQIKSIFGTNIFVGIVNSSFDGDAFCPCSTVDRLCLNCNRMEQTECECPCECPITKYDNSNKECFNKDLEDPDNQLQTTNSTNKFKIPVCPAINEEFDFNIISSDVVDRYNRKMDDNDFDLKPCLEVNCDIYTTQYDCLGIMGCEWCQIDVDSETPLPSPFCTSQISCYSGILGSMTPYGDGQIGPSNIDQIDPPVYSALGPVVGAIIALCLVVGFAMYCYKQNTDGSDTVEHLYVDSVLDNYGMPMARLDFKDLCQHDDQNDLIGGNANQKLLLNTGTTNSVVISEISPYRIATNYRRPNGDSDHGYSTMTPHEDSEHIGFNLAEPLIQQQKRLSMSDSASINTSVSSPHNYQLNLIPIDRPKPNHIYIDPSQTVLPLSLPSNHYEVAVDVHRNMEAT